MSILHFLIIPEPCLGKGVSIQDRQEIEMLCLRYVEDLSERTEHACRKLDMRAGFKSSKTLRGHLCRVKGKQPLKEYSMYQKRE